jgi:hypothetical protein
METGEEEALVKFLYSFGAERIPVKTEPPESLFSHSVNAYSIAKQLSELDCFSLNDEERKLIRVAALLHDFGKSRKEMGKESHKLKEDEFRGIYEKLTQSCPSLKVKDDFTLYLLSQGHHGEITSKEALKTKSGCNLLLLKEIVALSDWIASMNSVDSGIDISNFSVDFSQYFQLHYHKFERMRGILTLRLHELVEGFLTERDFIPLAFFPQGTLYAVMKGENIAAITEEDIKKEICGHLRDWLNDDRVLKTTMGYNPRTAIIGMRALLTIGTLDNLKKAALDLLQGPYGREDADLNKAKNWIVAFSKEMLSQTLLSASMDRDKGGVSLPKKVSKKFDESIKKAKEPMGAYEETLSLFFDEFKKCIDLVKAREQEEELYGKIWAEISQDTRFSFLHFTHGLEEPPETNDSSCRCALCYNNNSIESLLPLVGSGSQTFSDFNKGTTLKNSQICYLCAIEKALENLEKAKIQGGRDAEILPIYIFPEKSASDLLSRHMKQSLEDYINEIKEVDLEDKGSLRERIDELRAKFHIPQNKPIIQLLTRTPLMTYKNFFLLLCPSESYRGLVSRRPPGAARGIETQLGALYAGLCLYSLAPVVKVTDKEYTEEAVDIGLFKLKFKDKDTVLEVINTLDTLRGVFFQCDMSTILKVVKPYAKKPRYAQALFMRRFMQKRKRLTNNFVFLVNRLGGERMTIISPQTGVSIISVKDVKAPVDIQKLDKVGWFLAYTFQKLGVVEIKSGSRYGYTKPISLLRKEIRNQGQAGIRSFGSKLLNMANQQVDTKNRAERQKKIKINTKVVNEVVERLDELYKEIGSDIKFSRFIDALFESFLYYSAVVLHKGG